MYYDNYNFNILKKNKRAIFVRVNKSRGGRTAKAFIDFRNTFVRVIRDCEMAQNERRDLCERIHEKPLYHARRDFVIDSSVVFVLKIARARPEFVVNFRRVHYSLARRRIETQTYSRRNAEN